MKTSGCAGGSEFTALSRRGKYLIFELLEEWELIAHLRMTGRLIFYSNGEIPLAKHTSALFDFGDDGQLRFEDVRKFATLNLVKKGNYEQIRGLFTLGIEPLSADFTVEAFSQMLEGRQATIKGLLLDQTKVAGLGNIYVDESLFAAQIHPERAAGSLLMLKRNASIRRSLRCWRMQLPIKVPQSAITARGTGRKGRSKTNYLSTAKG